MFEIPRRTVWHKIQPAHQTAVWNRALSRQATTDNQVSFIRDSLFTSVADPGIFILDSGSNFFNPRSQIPAPGLTRSRIQIRIKEFKYLPKKLFLSSRKNYLGCSSRIPDLDFFPSRIPDLDFFPSQIPDLDFFPSWILDLDFFPSRIRIPDQGSKKHWIPDPGSGFAYTAYTRKIWRELHSGLYQEFSHLRDLLQNYLLSLLGLKQVREFLEDDQWWRWQGMKMIMIRDQSECQVLGKTGHSIASPNIY